MLRSYHSEHIPWFALVRRTRKGNVRTELPYGKPTKMPVIQEGDPIRSYSLDELKIIMAQREMKIEKTFSDFSGKPAGYNELPLIVYSTKHKMRTACDQEL